MPKKCQKCLLDTFEDPNDTSFRSETRSNKSGTRGTSSNRMQSLNADRSSSRERLMCQCNKPVQNKNNTAYPKRPCLDSSAVSNSSHNVGQRVSTPQEILTFSARGNSTFNSQLMEKQISNEAPSKSIGGGQSI